MKACSLFLFYILSNFSNSPFSMSFYGYDEIAQREKKGYTFWLLEDPTTGDAFRPDFAAVQTTAQLDTAVGVIGTHALRVLDDLRIQSGRRVEAVTIGKSHVTRARNKPFSPTDGDTWKMDGVRSRWNTRYKKAPFDCDALVVLTCFRRTDVPAALALHHFDHQDLTLKYEHLLDTWMRTNIGARGRMTTGDQGGGGRRSKAHIGFVLYMAVRFSAQ